SSVEKLTAALLEAKTEEERNSLLAANKEFATVELQRALVKEGRRILNQGEYSQATSIFHFAQTVAEQINAKVGISNALNGIGIVHKLQGNYGQALEYFQKSLALSEAINDNTGIARTLNNIGSVHYLQSDYELALDHYKKSLNLCEELKDIAGMNRALA